MNKEMDKERLEKIKVLDEITRHASKALSRKIIYTHEKDTMDMLTSDGSFLISNGIIDIETPRGEDIAIDIVIYFEITEGEEPYYRMAISRQNSEKLLETIEHQFQKSGDLLEEDYEFFGSLLFETMEQILWGAIFKQFMTSLNLEEEEEDIDE